MGPRIVTVWKLYRKLLLLPFLKPVTINRAPDPNVFSDEEPPTTRSGGGVKNDALIDNRAALYFISDPRCKLILFFRSTYLQAIIEAFDIVQIFIPFMGEVIPVTYGFGTVAKNASSRIAVIRSGQPETPVLVKIRRNPKTF